MATKKHNLSQFDSPLPSAAEMRFGIVVAEWNREVTEALLEGAVRTLRAAGCPDLNIQIKYVPGTFELALGAQFFAEYTDVDAVIALGCVIQGAAYAPYANAGTGFGLNNVDRRIRLYYDQEEGLSIESGPEGTRVSFRVPRKTREEIVDG